MTPAIGVSRSIKMVQTLTVFWYRLMALMPLWFEVLLASRFIRSNAELISGTGNADGKVLGALSISGTTVISSTRRLLHAYGHSNVY